MLVFLCAPLRGDVKANTEVAEAIQLELTRKGFAVFCPHTNFGWMLEHADDELDALAMSACHRFLGNSDVMFLVRGWGTSAGCRKEVALALSLNLPIFCCVDDLEELLLTNPTKET